MQSGDIQQVEECWSPDNPSPGTVTLAKNEIHLWRGILDVAPGKIAGLEARLQPDELQRASRFRFPEHRARFIAARGMLRNILGIHIGCAPESLRFAYGDHGKPSIATPAGTGIEFNLSHSAGLAIYAVALGKRVGVDVEFIKTEGSWLRIAEQYFTPLEAAGLAALPEEEMREKFFELWSAKEARLKALGVGLRFPLEQAGDTTSWQVLKLNPKVGYAAALAFEASPAPPAIIKHHYVI